MIKHLSDQLEKLLQKDGDELTLRATTAFEKQATPFEKAIILFGAGNLGLRTLNGLRKIGIEPLAFTDNNSKIWDSNIDGVQVLSPHDAVQRYGEKAVFVLTILSDIYGHPIESVKNQLNLYGPANIVSFASLYRIHKDTFLPYFCVDMPDKVLDQYEGIQAAAKLWSDDASCSEYLSQIKWRLSLDFNVLNGAVSHRPYLPNDLFSLDQKTVFIDCGAYDGDTLRDFLQVQGDNFRKVVAFEPDRANFSKLEKFVTALPRSISDKIKLHPLALGESKGRVFFDSSGTMQSAVVSSGSMEVECVPLDEILADEFPTYVKMDIEGAEPGALSGMKRIIMEEFPILAISVYHQIEHLWTLPLLIHSLSDKYHFFLRPHGATVLDLVCYAVPAHQLKTVR